ncbi:MAG: hypothetical protein WKG00_03430 [Polyangiaceae bacterium]
MLLALVTLAVGCADGEVVGSESTFEEGPPLPPEAKISYENECTWIQRRQATCWGDDITLPEVQAPLNVPMEECLPGSVDHREALCLMEFGCPELMDLTAWHACHGMV